MLKIAKNKQTKKQQRKIDIGRKANDFVLVHSIKFEPIQYANNL